MLRIRLRRTGAKKKPSYRVVVADARAPRDGAFLEILGHYNPLTDPSTVVIDAARARRWLSCGAQPTDRVARLFKREGIEHAPAEAVASPEAAGPQRAKAAAARTEAAADGEQTSGPARKTTRTRRVATGASPEAAEAVAAAEAATPEAEAPEAAADTAPSTRSRAPRRSKATAEGEPSESSGPA
jgi:small subunit ribosomal protein S16